MKRLAAQPLHIMLNDLPTYLRRSGGIVSAH